MRRTRAELLNTKLKVRKLQNLCKTFISEKKKKKGAGEKKYKNFVKQKDISYKNNGIFGVQTH